MIRRATLAVGVLALLLGAVQPVWAIPPFARKYRVSCSMCHAPAPRLTAFGEHFAGNGFEMMPGEPPRDTVHTGDPLLRLPKEVPLGVRIDAYAQMLAPAARDRAAVDLQLPYSIKVLSGGPIADKISYYMYFFLSERGEVKGLEDAYLQFTDIGGSGISVIVGQFQISDPLFKRELRLEYEDYQAYRVRVGNAVADLTYDRGIMASFSPWEGGDVVVEILNGTGLLGAGASRQYDRDDWKNFVARYSHDVGPVRLGGFGLYGVEEQGGVRNHVRILGPDLTMAMGPNVELNLQYLRRTDDRPFFDVPGGARNTTVDAAFAELIWAPRGPAGRLFVTGLYNWISSGEPVFTVRQGESGFLERYHSAAAGLSYLLSRNLRASGEAQWDFEREQARIVAGITAAF
ncbi:MAG TPA: hypothetical protein VIL18_07540 [Longimicrobiales bacterium]